MYMISKEISKVQNEVKKSSEKTLTGAVKAWCTLFKSGKEINVCFYLILKFAPFRPISLQYERAFLCLYFTE